GLALLPDGLVLAFGGCEATACNSDVISSSEIYDPATDSWSPAGSFTTARYNFAHTTLDDGRTFVVGGTDGTNKLASIEIFDPATGTWSTKTPLSENREAPVAA